MKPELRVFPVVLFLFLAGIVSLLIWRALSPPGDSGVAVPPGSPDSPAPEKSNPTSAGPSPAQASPPISEATPPPTVTLPRQDHDVLEAAARRRLESSGIYRFANAIPVRLSPADAGAWSRGADDLRVWRLRVHSPGAESLNLAFERFRLPGGARLTISSPDGKPDGITPDSATFTSADNEDHGQLWTPIFSGSTIDLELSTPAGVEKSVELTLTRVNHGFRSLEKSLEKIGAAASGGCHLDVACSADSLPGLGGIIDVFRDQVRSVGAFTLNGVEACSGALVNNTANDGRPFFLTAHHCGITETNASSMVVYWNFESDGCRTPGLGGNDVPGGGRLDQFNTGAIFRAASAVSDFCLVELDDPVDPAANPFFAGWDRSGNETPTSAGIHHPAVSEKRISLSFTNTTTTSWYENATPGNGSHVRVAWDHGATEGGSSGSPLFDENGRIIGQLHGGDSACYEAGYDWYGRFSRSWDGENSSSRLRDWLDPQGTNPVTLDGIDTQPMLTIGDAEVVEGNSGTVNAVFTVTLQPAAAAPVTVDYASSPDTAGSPDDFTAVTDSLVFDPGQTEKQIQVAVSGDSSSEEDERFHVVLSNASQAGIFRDTGNGVILNDDYAVPVINSALNVNAFVGRPLVFDVTALNTPRHFSLGPGAPEGMVLHPETGRLEWTPDAVGPVSVDIAAANPAGTDTETLHIQVGYGLVDHSADLPPVADQGNLAAGSVFAVCYYYKSFQEAREHGWDINDPAHQFSPTFILNQATFVGASPAQTYVDAWFVFDRLAETGCTTLDQSPFTPDDYFTWPSYAETLAALPFRADDYQFLGAGTSAGLIDDIRSRLEGGDLCVLEMPLWRAHPDTPGTFETLSEPEFDLPAGNETTYSGVHCVTIAGYDDSRFGGKGGFKIVNSVGTDWGDQGFAWISYDFVRLYGGLVFSMNDRIGYTPTATARLAFSHSFFNLDRVTVTIGAGAPDSPDWSKTAAYWGYILRNAHNVDIAVDLTEGAGQLPPTENRKWWVSLEDNQREDEGIITIFDITQGGTTYSAAKVMPVAGSELYGSTVHAFIPAGDNSASEYFVNDGDTSGDIYTSAVGNDANDGLSPSSPKATLQAVIDTYALKAGDVVRVDAGTYADEVTVTQLDRGEEGNRVRFVGVLASNGEPLTVIDRPTATGTVGLNLKEGARHVEFENIRFQGAYRAIEYDGQWTGTEDFVLKGIRISGASGPSVYLDGVSGAVFENCLFSDADSSHLLLESSRLELRNSTIHANSGRYCAQLFTGSNQSSPFLTINNSILYGAGSSPNLLTVSSGSAVPAYSVFASEAGRGIGITPDSTNVLADPLFADASNGDFHLQSDVGRWDPGANGGLGGFVVDGSQSPAIDAGDWAVSAVNEPSENGGRINAGAFGGTARASKSPGPARHLVLVAPETGNQSVDTVTIEWESFGNGWSPTDTLTLEYSDDGGSTWQAVPGAGSIDYDAGSFAWDASAIGPGTDFLVRLIANPEPAVFAESTGSFELRHATLYYVNDGSTAGDVYTTAVGNSANDGLSPATPKDSLQDILDTYDINPGDTIFVDTGAYSLTSTVSIGTADGGDAANPVSIVGVPGGTEFDRNSTSASVFSVAASHVSIENLFLTGGVYGAYLSNANGCRIRNCRITGNNQRGVYLNYSPSTEIENCIVDRNNTNGIYLYRSENSVFRNNTIFDNGGSQIYIQIYFSPYALTLENNIIRADGTWCLEQSGSGTTSGHIAFSDYNAFVTTGGGGIASFHQGKFSTLADWQNGMGFDANSLSKGVVFVDPDGPDDIAGNGDDDFHLQSTAGSWHDGAFSADGIDSPGIDAGNPTTDPSGESAPNGNRVNLGAYGGTTQASRTPSGRILTLITPNGGEVKSGTIEIAWATAGSGWSGSDTVAIEYSLDGGASWLPAAGGNSLAYDAGSFSWDASALGNSPFARIRITSNQDAGTQDASENEFLLRNSPISYYVNDASTTGDVYTSAAGAPGNDGFSPATPKDSIQDILDTYDIEPGDTIHVDAGDYTLTGSITVGEGDAGVETAPVRILGAPSWGATRIHRNSTSSSAYGIYLNNSRHIRLESLWIEGAGNGVRVYESPGFEILGCRLYSNGYYGVLILNNSDDGTIRHCLIDNNGERGISVSGADDLVIENCTITEHGVFGIYAGGSSPNVIVRNCIVAAASGSSKALEVAFSSSLAESDHNNFFLSNGARLESKDGTEHTSLASWQAATGLDLNSITNDPLFVDPDGPDDIPGNEDDDFHLQSSAGSWHGGAFSADAGDSPSIDAGDPGDAIAGESAPNGGRVNQGAFGATPRASRSPSGRVLSLLSPIADEVLAGTVRVTWRSSGLGWNPGDTVKLEFSLDNGLTWQTAGGGAALDHDAGAFDWNTIGDAADSPLARVRVVSNADPAVSGTSPNYQTLHNGPISFFVNDGSTTGDVYCSAAGNPGNDGLTPATPMDSIEAILDAYDLEGGDVIHVDTGNYTLTSSIRITREDSGTAEAPVRIVGAAPWMGTTIDRNNPGDDVFYLLDAEFVELANLALTGGGPGIDLHGSSDCRLSHLSIYGNAGWGINARSGAGGSDDLTVTNCVITHNTDAGVYAANSSRLTVENSTIAFNAGNEIWLRGTASNAVIRNNIIRADGTGGHRCIMLSYQNPVPAFSDYNDWFATNGAEVGARAQYSASSPSETFPALGDWQAYSGRDSHSLSVDPVFLDADGLDDIPGNADDDYHLQSTAGSWRGGTFAADATDSPAIDAGDPESDTGEESDPAGNRVNLGAFGGTAQASRSYAPRDLILLSPLGGETGKGEVEIRWKATGADFQPSDTVTLSYSTDGGATWTPIPGGASVPAIDGMFLWDLTGLEHGLTYRIRIVSDQAGGLTVDSGDFGVGGVYYVNDGDLTDDVYTTAIGDDGNSGTTPDAPMATIGALLTTYDLEPGDVVYVDAGTYAPSGTLLITDADGGSASGRVRFQGLQGKTVVSGGLEITGDYLTFDGFDFRGMIELKYGCSHAEIRHCRIEASPYSISFNNCFAAVARNNLIVQERDTPFNGGSLGAVQLRSTQPYLLATFTNNTVVTRNSIAATGYRADSIAEPIIRNNIFHATGSGFVLSDTQASGAFSKADFNVYHRSGNMAFGVLTGSDDFELQSLDDWRIYSEADLSSIEADPAFADPGQGDYHLRSAGGRFDPSLGLPPGNPGAWVMDTGTSPAVDAGDPGTDPGEESAPHGSVINAGAYGGTAEASRSPSAPRNLIFTNLSGIVSGVVRLNWRIDGAGWLPGDRVVFQYSNDGGVTWNDAAMTGDTSADSGFAFWDTTGLPNGVGHQVRAVLETDQSVIETAPVPTTVIHPEGGDWDLYVAPNGTDDEWHGTPENPFRSISYALDVAQGAAGAHVSIRVAAGTYQELVVMKPKVHLLGGYEPLGWTRDIPANETIIDGNAEGSVVKGADEALLEGFTITNGLANSGGGILCDDVSPVIRYCRVIGNTATNYGGGIYIRDSNAIVFSCVVAENEAGWGDGIDLVSCNAIVRNCTVVDNGGIGIRRINGGHPSVANCILWNNGDDIHGIGATYSIIENSDTGEGVLHDDPLLDANHRLTHDSPAFNTGANPETFQDWNDLDGRDRVLLGTVDIGAFEFSKPEIRVEEPAGTDLTDGGSTVHFGDVLLSESGQKTVTILNEGSETLTGLNITKSGGEAGDFTVGTLGATALAPGESTTFDVTFSPGAAGPRTAALHIASNDFDENPFDIDLAGTGVIPDIVVEQPAGVELSGGGSSIDFGSETPDSSSIRTFTIRNAGTGPLKNLAGAVSGAQAGEFTLGAFGSTTLLPGESTTVSVTFAPDGAGSRNALFRITSNDPDESPFDIALTGTGLDPEIAVEQPEGNFLIDEVSSVDFPEANVGASAPLTFTIHNTGTVPLTGLAASIDGPDASDFSPGSFGATSLNPGATTTVSITFTPTQTGPRSANLHLSSNDRDENPFDIVLSGNGVIPDIQVEQPAGTALTDGASTIDFGNQTSGSPASLTVTVRNTGTGPLTGLTPSVTGTHASEFSAGAPGVSTLAPGDSTTFPLTFTPGAGGIRNAALQIASNDPDEHPFDIALTGYSLAPEISVSVKGVELTSGSGETVFDEAGWLDGQTTSLVFTIENTGEAPLSGLSANINGPHRLDYNLGSLGATTLAPTETTSITVTFSPSTDGDRLALLRITSNDADENPFQVSIRGSRVERTDLTSWAESFGLSGDALLPGADDDGDFVTLLEEYAYNLNPTVPDLIFLIPGTGEAGLPAMGLAGSGTGQRLRTEFIRRRTDPDLEYHVEFGNVPSAEAPSGFAETTSPGTVTEIDSVFERVMVEDDVTAGEEFTRFGRVRIEYPNAP